MCSLADPKKSNPNLRPLAGIKRKIGLTPVIFLKNIDIEQQIYFENIIRKSLIDIEKKLSDIKSLAGKGAWVMMQRSFKEEIKDEKIKK